MTLCLLAILLILTLQLAVLTLNRGYWAFRSLKPASNPELPVPLHVLIPARNERENLPRLVESLSNQTQPADSIIICDDESTDGTREWLEANAQRFGLRWFLSTPRPNGWVGKNWACHQLSLKIPDAEGWLLFLDADLALHPHALAALRAIIVRTPATLITAIPRLIPSTIWDGLLLLMVPFSIFTTLPLYFAEHGRWRVFGFANGQVIAFQNLFYQAHRPHRAVCGAILEDVELAKWVKRQQLKAQIWDARPLIEARMYPNFDQAEAGFSKNAVAICGGVGKAFVIASLLAVVYLSPPLLLLAVDTEPTRQLSVFAIVTSFILFGVSGRMAGLPLYYGLLYPISVLLGLRVLARSIHWHRQGKIEWKGRYYNA